MTEETKNEKATGEGNEREKEGKMVVKEDDKKFQLQSINKKEKKKKRKKEEDNLDNQKIVLFEDNEVVEYDTSYFDKTKKRIVLPEEEYMSMLEHIIEKNYFPDLHKHKMDSLAEYVHGEIPIEPSEYLFDKESGNEMLTSKIDYQSIQSCSQQLVLDDSRDEYRMILLPSGKEHKLNMNMSLREFQKKYTSEDNQSFEYLINNVKKKRMEKNAVCLEQRENHNKRIRKMEEETKKGNSCYGISSTLAEPEDSAVMFSSSVFSKIKENDANMKSNKIQIFQENTRFSKEDQQEIKKQILRTDEVREQRLAQKEKNKITSKMVEDGKFHLLKNNNQYEYVRTPLIEAGKGIDEHPIITWGEIVNTPKLLEEASDDNEEFRSLENKQQNKKDVEEDEDNDDNDNNEFQLQKINKRELLADQLQNSLKGIKYDKYSLRNKNIKSLLFRDGNMSSRRSITSFRSSILSHSSKKRLNELSLKSSLPSLLWGRKKKT